MTSSNMVATSLEILSVEKTQGENVTTTALNVHMRDNSTFNHKVFIRQVALLMDFVYIPATKQVALQYIAH